MNHDDERSPKTEEIEAVKSPDNYSSSQEENQESIPNWQRKRSDWTVTRANNQSNLQKGSAIDNAESPSDADEKAKSRFGGRLNKKHRQSKKTTSPVMSKEQREVIYEKIIEEFIDNCRVKPQLFEKVRETAEYFRDHGLFYRERNHWHHVIATSFKWFLFLLGCVAITVLYFLFSDDYYYLAVLTLVAANVVCLIGLVRTHLDHLGERITVDATNIYVELAENGWLFLMGGGGEWATRSYSSFSPEPKTFAEKYLARNCRTGTVNLAGEEDARYLRNRKYIKDADRLKVALMISSYISTPGNLHHSFQY